MKKNRSWYKFNIRKYFPKSANRRICSLYVKVPGGGFLFCLLLEKCLFFMKTTNDILVSSGFLSWLLVKKKRSSLLIKVSFTLMMLLQYSRGIKCQSNGWHVSTVIRNVSCFQKERNQFVDPPCPTWLSITGCH